MGCRNRTPIRSAATKGGTPAQVALAWLLEQKPWVAPIPGSRKLERLDENNGALNIRMTADDLRRIDAAMAQIKVIGDRYKVPAAPFFLKLPDIQLH